MGWNMLKWICALWPLVVGVLVLAFYRSLAPTLSVAVGAEWAGAEDEYLRLRLNIENKGRVRAKLGKCRVQLLEHECGAGRRMSEWLPFEAAAIKPAEQPVAWVEPDEVKAPECLYPGEATAIEVLYRVPRKSVLLHAGFQVTVNVPCWQRRLSGQRHEWRNTATAWVVKEKKSGAA